MVRIVFLRHGESEWNKKNLFTGWTNVDLTKKGCAEARAAGELLKNFSFATIHTSRLKRATHTMELVKETAAIRAPVFHTWRLNERHYGALQGLNKQETLEKYGEKQVLLWRRSWSVAPPSLEENDSRSPRRDQLYADINSSELPLTESLEKCSQRTLPYWYQVLLPELKEGKEVLVVASGNSLRAIVKMLEGISEEEIAQLNIPTGVPLVYELDEKNNFRPIKHYYLGNQEEIERRIQEVRDQTKKS